MRRIVSLLSVLAMCLSALPAWAGCRRSALDRDLEDYVMASCLTMAGDAALKEQGHAWAGAILQRSHGDFQNFLPLADVVGKELERTGVGMAHRDGPVGSELPVPVLTCAEMRDRPAVQRAMAAARQTLRRAYGAAK